jgi:hypothetical protein
MKKSKRGKPKYFPQKMFFLNQGDREANRLRSQYRWLLGWQGSYFCDQEGSIWSACQNAIRRLCLNTNTTGYLRFKTSGGKQNMVARETLKAWRGPPPDGHECAHLDDVKTNNHINNLRWAPRGRAGDLQKILDSSPGHNLYVNGSNKLDSEWNKMMLRQAALMENHPVDCVCHICELRYHPEAVPLASRKPLRAGSRSIQTI